MALNLGSSRDVPFIVNAISHKVKTKFYVNKIVNLFKKNKINLIPYVINDINDFIKLCEKFKKKGKKAVIIGGGDGSVNLAVNIFAYSKTVLGLIPFGTSNVLANDLGLPMNPIKAAERILNSNIKEIDLGKIGDKYFALMITFGFDGFSVHHTNYWLKNFHGKLPYVISALLNIFKYKFPEIVVKLSNGEKYSAKTMIIANTRFYGGRFVPMPETKHDDGLFHILLINTNDKSYFSILKEWYLLWRGKLHTYKDVKILTASELFVYTNDKSNFQMDGDPYILTHSYVKIESKSLKIFV